MRNPKVHLSQTAESTPFVPQRNPGYAGLPSNITSSDTQTAIEEVSRLIQTSASPGFSFGRSGVTNSGTYLQCETVPSNISGRWVYVTSPSIRSVFVSNENVTTYTIEVMHHDGNGINLTSVGTVTVTAARGGAFSVNWTIPTNKQLAIRVATGTAKNIVCGLDLTGVA